MDIAQLDERAKIIVDCAYHIHRRIGPGLLESAYKVVLAADLRRRGLEVQKERPISFDYDGLLIRNAFKADLFIDSQILVEVKSVGTLVDIHEKQTLTYMKLLKCPLAFLINFGGVLIRDEIRRFRN
jgi:GxxExxY protein